MKRSAEGLQLAWSSGLLAEVLPMLLLSRLSDFEDKQISEFPFGLVLSGLQRDDSWRAFLGNQCFPTNSMTAEEEGKPPLGAGAFLIKILLQVTSLRRKSLALATAATHFHHVR